MGQKGVKRGGEMSGKSQRGAILVGFRPATGKYFRALRALKWTAVESRWSRSSLGYMCTNVCADTCIDMSIGMCMGVCMDVHMRHTA